MVELRERCTSWSEETWSDSSNGAPEVWEADAFSSLRCWLKRRSPPEIVRCHGRPSDGLEVQHRLDQADVGPFEVATAQVSLQNIPLLEIVDLNGAVIKQWDGGVLQVDLFNILHGKTFAHQCGDVSDEEEDLTFKALVDLGETNMGTDVLGATGRGQPKQIGAFLCPAETFGIQIIGEKSGQPWVNIVGVW